MAKKTQLYVNHIERLMIAQWIVETKRSVIKGTLQPQHVCAMVAFNHLCNGDHKLFESKEGQEAYSKVLTVAVNAGLVKVEWDENETG